MSYQTKLISADGSQQSKKIRRRFVPISFEITTQGQHVTFEQKLPFKTVKIVGLMTLVSQKLNALPDSCVPGVECPTELPIFPIPLDPDFTS